MKTNTKIIISTSGLAGFAAVFILMHCGAADAADDAIRYWFYNLRTDALNTFVTKFTLLGNWQTITALCIVFLLIRPLRSSFGLPLSAGSVLVTIINKIIKHLVCRPRPSDIVHLIQQGGFSFTSGHSIASMFFYGMLIYLVRKHIKKRTVRNILTVLLIIPMIGVGLSRIYCGVHYPSDVLAGWFLGVSAIAAASLIF